MPNKITNLIVIDVTVTNLNDSGARSLKEAIATAVAVDTITFDSSLNRGHY